MNEVGFGGWSGAVKGRGRRVTKGVGGAQRAVTHRTRAACMHGLATAAAFGLVAFFPCTIYTVATTVRSELVSLYVRGRFMIIFQGGDTNKNVYEK